MFRRPAASGASISDDGELGLQSPESKLFLQGMMGFEEAQLKKLFKLTVGPYPFG